MKEGTKEGRNEGKGQGRREIEEKREGRKVETIKLGKGNGRKECSY